MTDERWDVPSERLRRIASADGAPQFRECGACKHRHPKRERCGYPVEGNRACRCMA